MMDILTRAIATVAPNWAVKRLAAQLRLSAFQQLNRNFTSMRTGRTAYDAASRARTEADWPADLYSSDGALLPEHWAIVARARSAKNNHWAARSIADGYRRHVVGTGITCRSAIRDPATGEEMAALNQQIDAAWNRWADTPTLCDIEGKKTFVEIEGMTAEEYATVGEAFVVSTVHPVTGQFCLAMYEPEQLARDHEVPQNTGNAIRGGVEIDQYGKPIGYWFHTKHHPLEVYPDSPVFVPANRVHHFFVQSRARQTRGVSPMVTVLKKLRHLQMYEEYQIVRARVEACIALLITKNNPDAAGYGGVTPGAGTPTQDTAGNDLFDLQPGMVHKLNMGEGVEGFDPKAPGTTYEPFVNRQLKQIAAGAGLDYPTVCRDFSGGNFSSQREGHLERDKETDRLQKLMIDIVIKPVRCNFIDHAVMTGAIQMPGWYYTAKYRQRAYAVNIQPPPKPWIDPAKQSAGSKMAMEAGQATFQDECNILGKDWRQQILDRADAEKFARKHGVSLSWFADNTKAAPQEPRPEYDRSTAIGVEPNRNGLSNGRMHRVPVEVGS